MLKSGQRKHLFLFIILFYSSSFAFCQTEKNETLKLLNSFYLENNLGSTNIDSLGLEKKASSSITAYFKRKKELYLLVRSLDLKVEVSFFNKKEALSTVKYSLFQTYFLGSEKVHSYFLFDKQLNILDVVSEATMNLQFSEFVTTLTKADSVINIVNYINLQAENDSIYKWKNWTSNLFSAAYFQKAKYAVSIYNLDEAIAEYERALEISPNTIPIQIELGNTYFLKNDFKKSIDIYTNIIEETKVSIEALYNRSCAYFHLKKNKLALADLNNIIELNPQYSNAYFLKGNILLTKKEYKNAITNFKQCIKLDSENGDAYFNLWLAKFLYNDDYQSKNELYMARLYGSEKAINYINSNNITFPNHSYLLDAEFVYGNNELDSFVLDNFVRPYKCIKHSIDFNIQINFTVDSSGNISAVNKCKAEATYSGWSYGFKPTIDSISIALEKEAKRVILSSSGFWIPKESNDKKTWQNINYLIKIRPTDYNTRAMDYYNSGFSTSAPYTSPGPDLPFNSAPKYYNLGVKKLNQQKYFIAIKYFNQSILLDNKSKDSFYNLGLAYFLNKENKKACFSWKKAVSLGDKEAEKLIEEKCK